MAAPHKVRHALLHLLAAIVAFDRAGCQQPAVANFPASPSFVADGDRLHAFFLTAGIAQHQLSLDTGRTWSQSVAVANLPSQPLQPMGLGQAADSSFVALLYSSGNGPMLARSLDLGATWTAAAPISPTATATRGGKLRYVGGVLLAVWAEDRTSTGEVYASRSLDLGVSWSPEVRLDPVAVGIRQTFVPDLVGRAGALYAIWNVGVNFDGYEQVSTDLGATWLPSARALPPGSRGAFAADGAIVLAQCGSAIHRSADYGASWQAISPPMFQLGGVALAIDGSYALCAYCLPGLGGANTVASSDGGITWSPPSASLLLPYQSAFLFSVAMNGPRAAIGINSIWSSALNLGFYCYVTGDLGRSWSPQPVPGAASGYVLSVSDGFFTGYGAGANWHGTLLTGFQPYGPATAGSGAILPGLEHAGTPCLGNAVTLTITHAVGGAPALVAASLAGPAARPVGSATVLLADPIFPVWCFTSGSTGTPGAGSASIALTIPNSSGFAGQRIAWQGFVLDVGAMDGFSATAGSEMWIQ